MGNRIFLDNRFCKLECGNVIKLCAFDGVRIPFNDFFARHSNKVYKVRVNELRFELNFYL